MATYRNLLVPTDFSEYSKLAFDHAESLARAFGATVHLLFVLEPGLQAGDFSWAPVDEARLDEQHRLRAQQALETLGRERFGDRVRWIARVEVGKPFVAIVRAAREIPADLIVMASHGGGVVAHLLLGSTTDRVVRKAPCPVLTVRHPEHRFTMP
jgi:nucleotide-binding universal stress UspA family protein